MRCRRTCPARCVISTTANLTGCCGRLPKRPAGGAFVSMSRVAPLRHCANRRRAKEQARGRHPRPRPRRGLCRSRSATGEAASSTSVPLAVSSSNPASAQGSNDSEPVDSNSVIVSRLSRPAPLRPEACPRKGPRTNATRHRLNCGRRCGARRYRERPDHRLLPVLTNVSYKRNVTTVTHWDDSHGPQDCRIGLRGG